jgi:hypothetical protein
MVGLAAHRLVGASPAQRAAGRGARVRIGRAVSGVSGSGRGQERPGSG